VIVGEGSALGESPEPGPRTRWDERYADGDWAESAGPAAIVRDAAPWLARAKLERGTPERAKAARDERGPTTAPGSSPVALDLACGVGRNALFLAETGWRVMGVDLSVEGLRRMVRQGRSDALPILPVLADAGRFQVRPGTFDLVVNTFFLLRSAFPLIEAALRPGGLLLFETFSVLELDELGGDIRREFALERGELLEAFAGFEVLLHEEGVFEREEGERGLARMIARKR